MYYNTVQSFMYQQRGRSIVFSEFDITTEIIHEQGEVKRQIMQPAALQHPVQH